MSVNTDKNTNNIAEANRLPKTINVSKKAGKAANKNTLVKKDSGDHAAIEESDPRKVHELDPDNFFKLGKFRI